MIPSWLGSTDRIVPFSAYIHLPNPLLSAAEHGSTKPRVTFEQRAYPGQKYIFYKADKASASGKALKRNGDILYS